MQNIDKRLPTRVGTSKNSIHDLVPNEPTIFAQPSSGVKYTVNLTDDFDRPHTFDQVVALLQSATQEDEIVFNINSAGGYIDSLNMLLGWKQLCPARQVHVLMGDASSAASAFFLSKADQYIVGQGATMMIHEYQSGTFGTQSNNDRRNAHTKAQCDKFIRTTYKDFLTPEEIEDVLRGLEIYLDSDNILERMNNRLVALGVIGSDEATPMSLEKELELFKSTLSEMTFEEVLKEKEEIEAYLELAKEALSKFVQL